MNARRPLSSILTLAALAGCHGAPHGVLGTAPVPAAQAPVTPAAAQLPVRPGAVQLPSGSAAQQGPVPATALQPATPAGPGGAAPAGTGAGAAPVRPSASAAQAASFPAAKALPPVRAVTLRLAAGTPIAEVLAADAARGFKLLDNVQLRGRTVISLGLPAGLDAASAAVRLHAVRGVLSVEPSQTFRPNFTFTNADPGLGKQWAHQAGFADTQGAWGIVSPADQAKVIVAVLDTGCDVGHPEFAGRIVSPLDFTAGELPGQDLTDKVGHGTHVAGIIGAQGNNGQGCAGIAWGVKLMPLKVLGDGGGSNLDIVRAILFAAHYRPTPDDGSRVRVMNLSLGSQDGSVSPVFQDAMAEADANGVLVVVSAGNEGLELVDSPGNTPQAVAVGCSGHYLGWEHLTAFSNHGPRLDLVAPGENIYSTAPRAGSEIGTEYASISGTSMAAPFVAGVTALIAARYDKDNTHMTSDYAAAIRKRLLSAVDDLGAPGWDPIYGAGRINARKAVTPATLDAAP